MFVLNLLALKFLSGVEQMAARIAKLEVDGGRALDRELFKVCMYVCRAFKRKRSCRNHQYQS